MNCEKHIASLDLQDLAKYFRKSDVSENRSFYKMDFVKGIILSMKVNKTYHYQSSYESSNKVK